MKRSKRQRRLKRQQKRKGQALTLPVVKDTADAVPPELVPLLQQVQDGASLHWAEMFKLMRNGLVRRQKGVWIITALGLRVIGIALGFDDAKPQPAKQEEDAEADDESGDDESGDDESGDDESGDEDESESESDMNSRTKSALSMYLNEQFDQALGRVPGLTRLDLYARMARAAGVSDETINQMMSGILYPFSDEQLRDMAAAVGMEGQTLIDMYTQDQRLVRHDTAHLSGQALLSNLYVFKQASGDYRWVIISSSAYEDRDKETVAQKALAEDVERADQDGDYGPLLWWHTEKAAIGDCDYNAVGGPGDRFLIESGTFYDEETALAVQKSADKLGVSIGFEFPESARDEEGTFWKIRRRERSLLPTTWASNLFTSMITVHREKGMNTQGKFNEFIGLFDTPTQGMDVAMRMGSRLRELGEHAAQSGARAKQVAQREASVAENLVNTAQAAADQVAAGNLTAQAKPVAAKTTKEDALRPHSTADEDEVVRGVADAVMARLQPFLNQVEKAITTKEEVTAGDIAAATANGVQTEAETDPVQAQMVQLQQDMASLQDRYLELQKNFHGYSPQAGLIGTNDRASVSQFTALQPQMQGMQQKGYETVGHAAIDPMIAAVFGI